MNINKLMQIQNKLTKMLKEFEAKEFTFNDSSKLITIVINGKLKIEKILINKEIIDPNDVAFLEDLITVTINNAIENIEKEKQQIEKKVAGSMKMPGMF